MTFGDHFDGGADETQAAYAEAAAKHKVVENYPQQLVREEAARLLGDGAANVAEITVVYGVRDNEGEIWPYITLDEAKDGLEPDEEIVTRERIHTEWRLLEEDS